MVISFQLENVRNCLLEKGLVYTLRSKPHKVGKDWANSGRGTKKIANVNITNINAFIIELRRYLNYSGFDTPTQWINAYRKLNHDPLMRKVMLYKVEKIHEKG